MPPRPGPPLRKVTINLYEADCVKMEAELGYGWSEHVRRWVHERLRQRETVADFLEREGIES